MSTKNSPPMSICVAVIDPLGGHCGLDHYDYGLCRGLIADGCEVSLYTCNETKDPEIPRLRVQHTYHHIYGSTSRWMRGLRYMLGTLSSFTCALWRREKIVHFHFFHGSYAELILIVLSKLLGRHVVITVHDVQTLASSGSASRRQIAATYGRADRLIIHNEISRSELVHHFGVAPEKVVVIPHGNYLHSLDQLPSQQSARKLLGISSEAKVVLFFGQIKEVKGLDILIKAMPAAIAAIPNVILAIAGRPWKSDFAIHDAMIKELNIEAHCVLNIRFIPNSELPVFYAAADVIVLPYRKIYQSGVLLLTMSYAKAVIVSDIPGMTEIVHQGENGYVFAEGSSSDLADTLIQALSQDEQREIIAQNGLEYVSANNDWEMIGRMTAEVYREALQSR